LPWLLAVKKKKLHLHQLLSLHQHQPLLLQLLPMLPLLLPLLLPTLLLPLRLQQSLHRQPLPLPLLQLHPSNL
jgi:hypothetical protein